MFCLTFSLGDLIISDFKSIIIGDKCPYRKNRLNKSFRRWTLCHFLIFYGNRHQNRETSSPAGRGRNLLHNYILQYLRARKSHNNRIILCSINLKYFIENWLKIENLPPKVNYLSWRLRHIIRVRVWPTICYQELFIWAFAVASWELQMEWLVRETPWKHT